ncbi:unnamed protein product [Zymoseptoria tritici ST99CH_3D7]|uniref:Uncharacterized protein n=1 Tax=Zymoseptoria tritici (strain ST99CH_3D7) TaxID=1276538 RepID=A0A1X7RQQ4_ZYMT9|nr:unnamed protein product [Zymoseptoria tritici ST99CH_3D7]
MSAQSCWRREQTPTDDRELLEFIFDRLRLHIYETPYPLECIDPLHIDSASYRIHHFILETMQLTKSLLIAAATMLGAVTANTHMHCADCSLAAGICNYAGGTKAINGDDCCVPDWGVDKYYANCGRYCGGAHSLGAC